MKEPRRQTDARLRMERMIYVDFVPLTERRRTLLFHLALERLRAMIKVTQFTVNVSSSEHSPRGRYSWLLDGVSAENNVKADKKNSADWGGTSQEGEIGSV